VFLPWLLFTVTAFTSRLELAENYFEFSELNWLRTHYLKVASYWLEYYQSLRADCTENSASVFDTCLPNHCTATVMALTATNSLLSWLLPSNEQQTLVFLRHNSIVACLSRFLWLNSKYVAVYFWFVYVKSVPHKVCSYSMFMISFQTKLHLYLLFASCYV
jgi:hypothetical protein